MRQARAVPSVADMPRPLSPLAVALGLLMTTTTAFGAPADQVPAPAPENMRCPGVQPPALPGRGWQVQPVWDWRDVMHVDSPIGSSDGPYAVAVDGKCAIYLTDAEHFQVLKLSPDGTLTQRWKLPGDHAPGQSSSPRGVAVDPQGNVYVTDTPHDRVLKYSPRGEVVATWGECATPTEANKYCDTKQPGRFVAPEGIAVDGVGHVFVAEAAGLRVQRLSTDGQPQAIFDLASLGQLLIPGSLSIDQGGYLYMAEAFNNQVVKFDPGSGKVVGKWAASWAPGRASSTTRSA
jgi:DNA-binding beta-propeller fold protein YncE